MLLLLSLALAADSGHSFSQIPTAAPPLPAVAKGSPAQALQLMMLAFMQEPARFHTLATLESEPRAPDVDAVYQQCRAALMDGIRPKETGYRRAAKRQEDGLVYDCIDAAQALAEKHGVLAQKGPAAEALSPAASQPRFGVASCRSLLTSMAATAPSPVAPKPLEASVDGGQASVVLQIDAAGTPTVMGRLYGSEAGARACFAVVDGPWTPATNPKGKPIDSCHHHRCSVD